MSEGRSKKKIEKPQMKKLKILKITNEEIETTNKDIQNHK